MTLELSSLSYFRVICVKTLMVKQRLTTMYAYHGGDEIEILLQQEEQL